MSAGPVPVLVAFSESLQRRVGFIPGWELLELWLEFVLPELCTFRPTFPVCIWTYPLPTLTHHSLAAEVPDNIMNIRIKRLL